MSFVSTAHFIFCQYRYQSHSPALPLRLGCDRRFLFGACLGYFFTLARKKIDIKENGIAIRYLTFVANSGHNGEFEL